MKNWLSIKKLLLILSVICIGLSSGCVNRKSKNYLSSPYPTKVQTRKYEASKARTKVAVPAPVKEAAKPEEPKKKRGLWPFDGKKSKDPKKVKPSKTLPSVSGPEPYRYRLKHGDPIIITLRGIAGLGPVSERVDENGNIKLDYIDTVHAIGKTAAELEESIERAYLDQKIYRNLSVSVELPLKSYFIRGEVLKPAVFIAGRGNHISGDRDGWWL